MNRKARHYGVVLAICAVCAGVMAVLYGLGFAPLTDAEFYTQDLRVKRDRKDALRRPVGAYRRGPRTIRHISRNRSCRPRRSCGPSPSPTRGRAMSGRRSSQARGCGAKTIVIDLVFAAPKEGDDTLRRVLDKYRDGVVIGYAVDLNKTDRGNVFSLTLPTPRSSSRPRDISRWKMTGPAMSPSGPSRTTCCGGGYRHRDRDVDILPPRSCWNARRNRRSRIRPRRAQPP